MFQLLATIAIGTFVWAVVGFFVTQCWIHINEDRIQADTVTDLEYYLMFLVGGPWIWYVAYDPDFPDEEDG